MPIFNINLNVLRKAYEQGDDELLSKLCQPFYKRYTVGASLNLDFVRLFAYNWDLQDARFIQEILIFLKQSPPDKFTLILEHGLREFQQILGEIINCLKSDMSNSPRLLGRYLLDMASDMQFALPPPEFSDLEFVKKSETMQITYDVIAQYFTFAQQIIDNEILSFTPEAKTYAIQKLATLKKYNFWFYHKTGFTDLRKIVTLMHEGICPQHYEVSGQEDRPQKNVVCLYVERSFIYKKYWMIDVQMGAQAVSFIINPEWVVKNLNHFFAYPNMNDMDYPSAGMREIYGIFDYVDDKEVDTDISIPADQIYGIVFLRIEASRNFFIAYRQVLEHYPSLACPLFTFGQKMGQLELIWPLQA